LQPDQRQPAEQAARLSLEAGGVLRQVAEAALLGAAPHARGARRGAGRGGVVMAKPKAAEIRGYNVGVGDCFLLSFDYGQSAKHVLIDFGSTEVPGKAPSDYMMKIAESIKTECGG